MSDRDHGSNLRLPDDVVAAMRAELGTAAQRVIDTIIREVPSYSEPFRGRMGRNISSAVTMALGGFLDMVSTDAAGTRSIEPVFEAAYALGRGEARSGRTMDALAAAYRVGARTAWHELSVTAVDAGLQPGHLAAFAELVFDYIDQLSSTSVSGHADELSTSGRVRERHLERLADSLLAGSDEVTLTALVERAAWPPPETLTAVIVPESMVGAVRSQLDARTLLPSGDAPGLEEHPHLVVLLAADLHRDARRDLVAALADREAMVGPAAPWQEVRSSYLRALRAVNLGLEPSASAEVADHLVDLVLTADPEALAALRHRVLAPMAGLRPSTVEKLTETLRAWLLHQGRRDDIAAALFVHPQTVRYRVGRLRDLYGERLADPQFVLEATIALGTPT